MFEENNNLLTLKSILRMTQEELLSYTEKELLSYGYRQVLATSDYVYAEGNIPVLMVAHLDTVHQVLPENINYDRATNTLSSPQGLGADDRAGVFAILKIIEAGLKPHALFTRDEEIGSLGAKCFLHEMDCPNIKYIIQLDRKNAKDAVFYDCLNKQFIDYILSFGFVFAKGTSTDIRHLCTAWDIAGVNLSIGFYNEHTKEEYLNINNMLETIHIVKEILADSSQQQRFPFG